MQRSLTVLSILIVGVILSFLCALCVGSVHLSVITIFRELLPPALQANEHIIIGLRLTRAMVAFATGGLLAVAGVLLQVLLVNPLADPYVLGVSGGAACFSLLGILVGASGYMVTTLGMSGALVAMLLIFILARQYRGWSPQLLLLIGIILAAGWGALISLLLSLSEAHHSQAMLFWLMGDLSHSSYPLPGLIVLLMGVALTMYLAPQMDIMMYGANQAQVLGVNTKYLSCQLLLLSSILTAFAVNLAGTIGFIGLIVPHMLRLMHTSSHRFIIPAAALLGGSLLLMADTLARTVIAPAQLPVGVVTALLGIPAFLYFLLRKHLC